MRQAVIFAFLSLAASFVAAFTPPPAACPTFSCASCPAGQTQTQTRSAPGACLECGCASATTTIPCPTFTCAACPSGETHTFTRPAPTACPQCACVKPTTTGVTTTKPTSVTLPTTTSCPTFSCASCPAGQTQTQTRSAPGACLQCACAKSTTTTAKPTTSTISTTTAACPTFSCASCPLGQTQTQTPGANGCLKCGCATPAALGTITVPPAAQTGTTTTAASESTTTADTDTTSGSANSDNGGVLGGNGAPGNQRAATSLLGVGSVLSFLLTFL